MNNDAATKKREILRARAQALARPPALAEGAGGRVEVVEFLLAGERYGFATAQVREVYPLKELTPLPCVPPWVAGIVNVRGQIVAVADLKALLDLPGTALSDQSRVIILQRKHQQLGVLADVVPGVRSLSAGELQPSLPTLTGVRAEFLHGVTADRLVVLDAEKLLSSARMQVREEVEG